MPIGCFEPQPGKAPLRKADSASQPDVTALNIGKLAPRPTSPLQLPSSPSVSPQEQHARPSGKMEVAASAIAFAQAVGVIGAGLKKLRTMQQASTEFMDLLNQLSRCFPTGHRAIRGLQGDLSKIGEELGGSAAGFIATSRGLDEEGRHRIRKLKWQKEQARLIKLRDRARELSIDMSSCLTAINMAQGIRQTGMVLEVRRFMEVSFANVTSQLDHQGTLLLEGARTPPQARESDNDSTSDHHFPSSFGSRQKSNVIRNKIILSPGTETFDSDSESILSTVPDTDPQLWLSKLAAEERQITSCPPSTAQIPALDLQPTITITSTLRPACPPNCPCHCHVTSHVASPLWARTALGMLMVNYRSLPSLGMSRCNAPLCNSASGSSFHIQYCFPRWLVARALQFSMSWGSLTDGGASIFLKLPRSVDSHWWINDQFIRSTVLLDYVRTGDIRPTDIFIDSGQTALTSCMEDERWDWLETYLQHGFDPTQVDMTGMSAVHWAQQYMLDGLVAEESPPTQKLLGQLSVMKLPGDNTTPITLIQQFIRGTTPLSSRECLQAQPHHVNTVDELGFAPLHWAARRVDPGAVQTLLAAGADINQQASHIRETPLLLACIRPRAGATDLVKLLLQYGASPRISILGGWTPLHHVAQEFYPLRNEAYDLAHMLLDHGADPRARTVYNDEPLHRLAWADAGASHTAIKKFVTLLLDHGADLECKGVGGSKPLLNACASGNVTMAHVLLELGADKLATNDNTYNCLQCFAEAPPQQDPSSLPPTLLFGVDPDAKNRFGNTTLNTLDIRVSEPDFWGFVPIRWLVGMIALILATREANWKAGNFLETQESLLEKDDHASLVKWVARQRRRIERNPSFGDLDCLDDSIEDVHETDDDASSCSGSEPEDEENSEQDIMDSEDDEEDIFHDALEGAGR